MSYPLILLVSAACGIVVSVLTAGGIVWRGIFVVGRMVGEFGKMLQGLVEDVAGLRTEVHDIHEVVGEQAVQIARLDERFDALDDRLTRGGL